MSAAASAIPVPAQEEGEGDLAPEFDPFLDDSLTFTLFPALKEGQQAYPGAPSTDTAETLAVYNHYLQDLAALNLDKLTQQPSFLADTQKQLRREMDELAFKNYKVFLQSANTFQLIRSEMSKIGGRLGHLIDNLPELTVQCQDFCKTAQSVAKSRQIHHKTLKQHTAILELLELPQLMDTCVKNNHFEEALELEQFARRMLSQHPDIPVVADILEEVKTSVGAMQLQICQQLCGPVDLPAALRAIGYLKRLGSTSERELRTSFLYCRTVFLTDALSQIPTANAYNYLTKMIDTYRTHLSDISNQYRAIFDHSIDEDVPVSEESAILNAWTIEKVGEFLNQISPKLVELTDGASLGDVLNKAMYFGSYMGRVGVEFRSLLIPYFEQAVQHLFKSNLNQAQHSFSQYLKKNRTLSLTKGLLSYSGSNLTKRDPLAPPLVLLDYPALAVLGNGILTAFNELRKCCPVSLQYTIATDLEKFLTQTLEGIKQFKKDVSPTEQEELEAFQDMCRICCEELLPYLAKCLDSIFRSPRRLMQLEKLQDVLSTMYEKRIAAATIDQLMQSEPTPAVPSPSSEPTVTAPAQRPAASPDADTAPKPQE